MTRRGRITFMNLLVFVGIFGGALAGHLFLPPYLVYLKMKEITKSCVLDWAGLNEQKARRRLSEEFRRQEIPDYIQEKYCTFKTEGVEKIVTCSWDIDVYYPFTNYYKTLSYTTWASHDGIGVSTD